MPLFSPSRILRAITQDSKPIKWAETLALPKSAFPARPTALQLELYRRRCADDLYAWQRVNRPQNVQRSGVDGNNEFILHDGPPYANGAVHVGHALNKVLKDIILRWQLASGKRVRYQPGWDCHGLPIELKALQAYKTQTEQAKSIEDAPEEEAAAAPGAGMSASEIRSVAKELASKTIETQKASFREWGVMGEWDAPYKTMDSSFEIAQLEVFKEMAKNGLISRHHRPVYWSPSSRTALAEAELEYDDNHRCTAAFIKMRFVKLPKVLETLSQTQAQTLNALIWTTTPWTLPANSAIAVHPHIEYTVIKVQRGSTEDVLLVAKERVTHVLSFLPEETSTETVIDSVSGKSLADGQATCFNMFQGRESPILEAEFVTTASGTGLVHMAPSHGMEDYLVCQQNHIHSFVSPVDDDGRFTREAFPAGGHEELLQGLDVQTDGVRAVLVVLSKASKFGHPRLENPNDDLVLASHDFVHKNPIDWRTKQPVIVRATAQWFADVSAIKDRALKAIDGVEFIPETGKTRLQTFVEGRSQWCISRQRAWGVPIPALYHNETGEVCINEVSISHIIETIRERGTDAWFSDPPNERAWIHPSLELDAWTRGRDTMDVWFDSGTTWTTMNSKQADVYIEGTDQHRGWFQSSLLTSIASQKAANAASAPFKTLITHGFILDAAGRKMSKSIGNVISPDQILDGSLLPPIKVRKQRGKGNNFVSKKEGPTFDAMGPDVLRLWVASSDYTRDVSISVPVLQSVQQALQKYRVTFKFLLGVLSDYDGFDASRHDEDKTLPFADRAVLHQLSKTSHVVHQAYKEYKFYKVVNEINTFVSSDLSAFYFEVIKDTMYAGGEDVRRQTQRVLSMILWEMLRMLGPIAPHLVEEVWEFMPEKMKFDGSGVSEFSPLQAVWSEPFAANNFTAGSEEQELEVFKPLSAAVKLAQEEARGAGKLGSGLGCAVEIWLPPGSSSTAQEYISWWGSSEQLADLLVVSSARVKFQNTHQALQHEWQNVQPFHLAAGETQNVAKVVITPPEHHKCVRCWKYTTVEKEVPCKRCQVVLNEAELWGKWLYR